MLYRTFSMSALALALSLGALTVSAKDAEKGTKTHDGKFVSASGDQFVMTHKKGKEHAHTLAADAKITCDGKVCEAADLKSDMRIRVTTKPVARKQWLQSKPLKSRTNLRVSTRVLSSASAARS